MSSDTTLFLKSSITWFTTLWSSNISSSFSFHARAFFFIFIYAQFIIVFFAIPSMYDSPTSWNVFDTHFCNRPLSDSSCITLSIHKSSGVIIDFPITAFPASHRLLNIPFSKNENAKSWIWEIADIGDHIVVRYARERYDCTHAPIALSANLAFRTLVIVISSTGFIVPSATSFSVHAPIESFRSHVLLIISWYFFFRSS